MENEVILKIENLSKQYRLGTIGTGTISHDFNRFLAKLRGKEDPFLKIGESNDRASKGKSEYVWALKDINFEVKRGEVIGIIGKNGAGKSTLLKVLSKVTGPSTGSIKSRGRIASLLEVGTGFHPEMTGKENIFLNGAILGMTKQEISEKLDEIVSFSGCQRYIDTPVKRYSSGMKVRLAFAVAAHLEPDILIVDEVLAVGDAEFQKKAIGKMQDISKGEGRTVLFVSHNLTSVKKLCTKGVVLENGKIVKIGSVDECIAEYTKIAQKSIGESTKYIDHTNELKFISKNFLVNHKEVPDKTILFLGDSIEINFSLQTLKELQNLSFALEIINLNDELVAHLTNEDSGLLFPNTAADITLNLKVKTDKIIFIPGEYSINLWIGKDNRDTLFEVKNLFSFSLEKGNLSQRSTRIPKHSKVYLPSKWNTSID